MLINDDVYQILESIAAREDALDNDAMNWRDRRIRTQKLQRQRQAVLQRLGLGSSTTQAGVLSPEPSDPGHFVQAQQRLPHLINLSEDPMFTATLVYTVPQGTTRVGREDAPRRQVCEGDRKPELLDCPPSSRQSYELA